MADFGAIIVKAVERGIGEIIDHILQECKENPEEAVEILVRHKDKFLSYALPAATVAAPKAKKVTKAVIGECQYQIRGKNPRKCGKSATVTGEDGEVYCTTHGAKAEEAASKAKKVNDVSVKAKLMSMQLFDAPDDVFVQINDYNGDGPHVFAHKQARGDGDRTVGAASGYLRDITADEEKKLQLKSLLVVPKQDRLKMIAEQNQKLADYANRKDEPKLNGVKPLDEKAKPKAKPKKDDSDDEKPKAKGKKAESDDEKPKAKGKKAESDDEKPKAKGKAADEKPKKPVISKEDDSSFEEDDDDDDEEL